MISDFHLTKAAAERALEAAKFGDEGCIAAVRRLSISEDLEDFLRTRGSEPDKLSLQEINELAEQMGYEPYETED